MTPNTFKAEPLYQPIIEQATVAFFAASGKDGKDLLPYTFTSNFADAFLITLWALYHYGISPYGLRKSTGHSWLAEIKGLGVVRLVVEKNDHRDGVKVITKEEQP